MSPKQLASHQSDEPDWKAVSIKTCSCVLAAFAVLSLIQLIGWVIAVCIAGAPATDAFGVSGDFFGFVNSVFSALAFAMIIVTLWMQKHELALQRKEISQTQEIINAQKMEMQRQADSLARQTFENTFFNMLQLLSDIVGTMTDEQGVVHGRSIFRVLLNDLKDREVGSARTAFQNLSDLSTAVREYNRWYFDNDKLLGHYLRTLYNLVRFVHEKGGDETDMYMQLVRAQLSSEELEILLYNGLGEHGKKFKEKIEQYTLLKHLRPPHDLSLWMEEYQDTAFEDDAGTF